MKLSRITTTTALVSATIWAMAASAQAETVLRFADGSPNRGARAEAQEYFAKQVEELSGGDVMIEFHWGGALLKFDAMLRGISVGTTDIGVGVAVYEPKGLMGLAVADLAAGSSDPWVEASAVYELMTTNADMQKMMEAQNIVYLGTAETGPLSFECKGDAVDSVDDLKGRKIRANGIYAQVMGDLGATVVPSTYSEVYQHLDTGLIDCNVGFYYTNRAYRIYEVLDHITEINWGQYAGISIDINRDIFGDLPEKDQQALREAGRLMTEDMAHRLIDETEGVRQGIMSGEIGKKVPITQLSDEERQKLIEASQKYVDAWIGEVSAAGYDGKAIFDQYKTLVAKYDAELQEKGYPWNR